MAYSGRFKPKNPGKYEGDVDNIVYRSMWEYQALRWCDLNDDVVKYSSEEVVVPYRCRTDGKKHRYFIDLKIKFRTGKTLIVEIKPKKETQKPQQRKRKTQKYLNEALTYMKNISKWDAADQFAYERGWSFQIWTEDTLQKLGILTGST